MVMRLEIDLVIDTPLLQKKDYQGRFLCREHVDFVYDAWNIRDVTLFAIGSDTTYEQRCGLEANDMHALLEVQNMAMENLNRSYYRSCKV